jgi:hypothetical protein
MDKMVGWGGASRWSMVAEMWGNDGGGTNTASILNNVSNIRTKHPMIKATKQQ